MAGIPFTATRNRTTAIAQNRALINDQLSPEYGIRGLGWGGNSGQRVFATGEGLFVALF